MLETIHYLKVMLQPVLGKYMIMIQGLQLEGGEISLREEKSALGRRNQLEGGENSLRDEKTAWGMRKQLEGGEISLREERTALFVQPLQESKKGLLVSACGLQEMWLRLVCWQAHAALHLILNFFPELQAPLRFATVLSSLPPPPSCSSSPLFFSSSFWSFKQSGSVFLLLVFGF